jgi:hypothetical protein
MPRRTASIAAVAAAIVIASGASVLGQSPASRLAMPSVVRCVTIDGVMPGARWDPETLHRAIVAGSATIEAVGPPAQCSLPGWGASAALDPADAQATVHTPDLRGHTELHALSELAATGLRSGHRSERYDASVPAGHIIDSDPPGRALVPPDSAIAYVVSLGPSPRSVERSSSIEWWITIDGVTRGAGSDPEALGQAIADGSATIEAIGPPADCSAPGSAASATPSPTVTATTVHVPRLPGLTEAEGICALAAAGLQPGQRRERHDPDIPAGHIIEGDAGSGTLVPPGSAIAYVLSLGPEQSPTPEPTAAAARYKVSLWSQPNGCFITDFHDKQGHRRSGFIIHFRLHIAVLSGTPGRLWVDRYFDMTDVGEDYIPVPVRPRRNQLTLTRSKVDAGLWNVPQLHAGDKKDILWAVFIRSRWTEWLYVGIMEGPATGDESSAIETALESGWSRDWERSATVSHC